MEKTHKVWVAAVAATALTMVISCSEPPSAPSISENGDVALEASDRDARGAELPFAKLKLFFEFNSTDNDLGVQLLLDADDWQHIEGSDPRGKKIVDIDARGRLKDLGLTELFFESAEPSPQEVLDMIPAGTYSFSGKTVDGERIAGTANLSHTLPPAPSFSPSQGEVVDISSAVITWKGITGLASYQVIVSEETLGMEMTVDLDAATTTLQVPTAFLHRDTEYKVEVLAIGTNGNKTITEGTFRTKP